MSIRLTSSGRLVVIAIVSCECAGPLQVAAQPQPPANRDVRGRASPRGALKARDAVCQAIPPAICCDEVPLPVYGCTKPLSAEGTWEPSIAVNARPSRPGEETVVVAFIAAGFWTPLPRHTTTSAPNGPAKRIAYAFGTRSGPGQPVHWKPGRALAPCDNESDFGGAYPCVAAGLDGVFYCAALMETRPITVRLFKSRYVGDDLMFDQIGPNLDFDGKPWVAVDRTDGAGRGTVYLTFTCKEAGGPCPLCQFTRSTDGGATWLAPITLPLTLGANTRTTLGPDGELYIAGHTCCINTCPVGAGFHVLKSTNAYAATPTFSEVAGSPVSLGGQWTGVATSCPNSRVLGQSWIVCNHCTGPLRGSLGLLCSVDPPGKDPMDVMFAWNRNDGSGWSAPQRLNAENPDAWQWFGTMSQAPNGRIDAAWNESLNSSCTTSQLYYAYRGTQKPVPAWSAPVAIANPWTMGTGWHIGVCQQMISDDLGTDLAVARVDAGPRGRDRRVYYLRINTPK